MEYLLLSEFVLVKEFNFHVIVYKQILSFNPEVIIRQRMQSFSFPFILIIINDLILHFYPKSRLKSTILYLRYGNHAYLVYFKHYYRHSNHVRVILVVQLQEALKVVYITYLRGYSHSFPIGGADLAIVDQGIMGRFKLPGKQQVAADHNASATFTCFTMYSCHIPLVFFQEFILSCLVNGSYHIEAKLEYHVKYWRVMVFKGKSLASALEAFITVSSFLA